MALVEKNVSIPAEVESLVFGQFDTYARKIERTLNVTILSRDGETKVIGTESGTAGAKRVLEDLARLAGQGSGITEQNVNYALSLALEKQDGSVAVIDRDIICHTIGGKPVSPKTYGQKQYVDAIRSHMITFGIGPAGTGKTYLAMAMAITAFRNEEVSRIIMTRPPDSYQKNAEKGAIEVAPLAYMRGRTLDNAFIILDEAQNTTPAQMKMFLTRIGFGSKVIVTGDMTQKDLAPDSRSGLEVAIDVLKKIDDIAFCELTSKDVVRHPLVQKIVQAYERYEERGNRMRAHRDRPRQESGRF